MKRVDIDKEIKASSTEKFCKILREKGYDWAADEMTESVSNGCVCDRAQFEDWGSNFSENYRLVLLLGDRTT